MTAGDRKFVDLLSEYQICATELSGTSIIMWSKGLSVCLLQPQLTALWRCELDMWSIALRRLWSVPCEVWLNSFGGTALGQRDWPLIGTTACSWNWTEFEKMSLTPANTTEVYQNKIILRWGNGRANYQQNDQFQFSRISSSVSPTHNSRHIKASLNIKLRTEEIKKIQIRLFLGGGAYCKRGVGLIVSL